MSEPRASKPASPPVPSAGARRRDSLAVRGVLGLTLVLAVLLLGIFLLMSTYGKRLVIAESKRRIAETGNRSVEELERRLREISSLARTLAATVAALPKDDATLRALLPSLLDFQGDKGVAGGGYWPEPGAFTPGVERQSFFWGRGPANQLQLYDNYNAALGPGYRNEEWYVTARYLAPGKVFWSKAYMEPYTYQPMVTCTANVYEGGKFTGTATVNLKLAGLSEILRLWQQDFGGYGFLLDRYNGFLAFPRQPRLTARRGPSDDQGHPTLEVTRTADLAKARPDFKPIAAALDAMDRDILERSRHQPGFRPELAARLDGESYQIGRDVPHEAELIVAALADPLAVGRSKNGYLYKAIDVPRDFLTGGPALAFLFNVPDSYWKLVLVIPEEKAEEVAARISRLLLFAIAGVTLPVLALAYFLLSRKWIHPITALAGAARAVRDGRLDVRVEPKGKDEIGELADSFNGMVTQLRANTEDLHQANRELSRTLSMTKTIMGTVHEGLFLLSPELAIEAEYSAALCRILGRTDLAGASFPEMIEKITPEKTRDLTARFLRLLFNPEKTDSVIAKINPLKEVETHFQGEGGQLEPKYLTFNFDRIWNQGEIEQAMVTVEDVTAEVLLARQLKESQRRMERQAELLMSVMHVEPDMLRDFIDGSHAELARVNEALRHGQGTVLSNWERQAFYHQLADQIYKSVHTIKGTAAMLRIDYFSAAAHHFEDRIAELRRHHYLSGDSFLPIVLELSGMIDSLAEIREVIDRFAAIKRPADPAAARTDADLLASVVESFVSELGAKYGKKAALSFQAGNGVRIPFRHKTTIRNILAQLVRNSFVHGLETPAERSTAGKPEQGNILIATRESQGQLELLYRDDGRGIDYQRLIEQVRELAKSDPGLLDRLIDPEQNQWRRGALDEMIFHPGLSTAEEASEDAGRGIGLSAVAGMVHDLGGRIAVRQRPGQFCEFYIAFPA